MVFVNVVITGIYQYPFSSGLRYGKRFCLDYADNEGSENTFFVNVIITGIRQHPCSFRLGYGRSFRFDYADNECEEIMVFINVITGRF